MQYTDFKTRFAAVYNGDLHDPVFAMLLDALDSYQKDIEQEYLLSTYADWGGSHTSGLFEVLRRHLFGQMFPGPVYTVAQADLRDVENAEALALEQYHHFSLQDGEGNKVLFTPMKKAWILPAYSNDVLVESDGPDLRLGFRVIADNLPAGSQINISMFGRDVEPLLLEQLRCRLERMSGFRPAGQNYFSPIRPTYPGVFTAADHFFTTPFDRLFVSIPIETLRAAHNSDASRGVSWLNFEGLGDYAATLQKRLTINSLPLWNLERRSTVAEKTADSTHSFRLIGSTQQQRIIARVEDSGAEPPIEYIDAASVMDPAYPYQFTSSISAANDEYYLAVTRAPAGDLTVHYCQYDLSDLTVNIAVGRGFGLYQGIDEKLRGLQTLLPTRRNEALNDKEQIWAYFQSLVASRNRVVSKADLIAAIHTYPPLAGQERAIHLERIIMQESVGRVRGFLTPFTQIGVPVSDERLLQQPDKAHFERGLGRYLKHKSSAGNFLQVQFIGAKGL